MIITFWFLLLLIIYCYFGYPILLNIVVKCARRTTNKRCYEPTITIILSIWNEEDVIKNKIDNLLTLNYPQEKMEILVGSDGSTDQTNKIVQQYTSSSIRLIEHADRRGKMITINNLVAQAKNEIIVFTDARQEFEKNAIKELMDNFSDSKIGCVSGELVFSKNNGATAQGINLYWNYEKYIRQRESDVHSMLGATGAIYAIRRELFSEVPQKIVLDDMYIPFKIIQKGYRAIFDSSARAFDEVADSPREEYRRKTRTLFGNYQMFWIFRNMFNPLTSPIAFQFFSHKLLRVLIPFFMITIFIVNCFLIEEPMYQVFLILQCMFYGMAIIGGLARYQKYGILNVISKICYIPYVFCLLNISALIGFLRFAGSKQDITWEKARDQ